VIIGTHIEYYLKYYTNQYVRMHVEYYLKYTILYATRLYIAHCTVLGLVLVH
jgi:hypothetical protein